MKNKILLGVTASTAFLFIGLLTYTAAELGVRPALMAAVGATGTAPSGYDVLVSVNTAEDLNSLWDEAVVLAKSGERVLVSLASGVHTISRPLTMLGSSAGARGHITLQGAEDGGSIITSGKQVNGWQQTTINGRTMWRASYSGDVSTVAFGTDRGTRARFPNKDVPSSDYPRVVNFDAEERDMVIEFPVGSDGRVLYPDDLNYNPEIIIPIDGDIVQMRIAGIREVDNGYVILPKEREREVFFYTAFRPGDMSSHFKTDAYADPSGSTHGYYVELADRAQAYWLENSIRLLDQPGEWYYSEDTNDLYIIPPAGFDPTQGDVWVNGEVDQHLIAIGDHVTSLPSLHIEGLTFFMTGYERKANGGTYRSVAAGQTPSAPELYGPADGGRIGRFSGMPHTFIYDANIGKRRPVLGYEDPAAVYLENVSGVGIVDSRFAALGGGALRVAGEIKNLNIHSNIFQDVSSFGVMLRNSTGPVVDYDKVDDVVIAHNLLTRVGMQYTGVPIFVQEKDHQNVTVHNNEIIDAPFYGIALSTGQNSRILNNKIVRAMSMQTDGGAIWATNVPDRKSGTAGGHEIVGNYIEDINIPEFTRRNAGHTLISAGIYVDGGYKLSVRGNYVNDAPIGIYYLCPHAEFYLVSNYLAATDNPEWYYRDCPTVADGENLGRSLPVVEPTSSTVNNQLSAHPNQYLVQANAGVLASVYESWKKKGWMGGAGVVKPKTLTIYGIVWNDENGDGRTDGEPRLAGRPVTLLDSVTGEIIDVAETSDKETGSYRFVDVAAGTYRIAHAVPEGYVRSTDDSLIINVNADTQVNFGIRTPGGTGNFEISGTVWNDVDGDRKIDSGEGGLSGRTVQLLNDSTRAVIKSVSTNNSGQYQFTDLAEGTYRVAHAVPGGYERTGDDSMKVTLKNDLTVNFGIRQSGTNPEPIPDTTTYNISGTVWLDHNANGSIDSDEGLMSERTVSLLDNNTRAVMQTRSTNSQGYYEFANLPGGVYRVEFPTPSGLTRTTDNSYATTLNENRVLNFGVRQ